MPILPLLLALQAPIPADAYADSLARALVAGARGRRETVDRSISSYRVLAKERIGVGIRALRRDRMVFAREMAARVEWFRDSIGRIEVVGARQRVPVAEPDAEVAEDLDDVVSLAFDPGDAGILKMGGSDSGVVRHPLAAGSERDYRYQSGDSTSLTFPDGRTLKLYELRVIPRRPDFNLISGALWIESEGHAVVRALFRMARPFDLQRDLADSADDVPRWVKVKAELRYLEIEYGLWDSRWWLPRLIAMEGTASLGSLLTTPMRYERVYADYEVQADSTPRREARVPVRTDSASRAAAREQCQAQGKDVHCECRGGDHCLAFRLTIPTDSVRLLTSSELPPTFVGLGDSIMSASELGDLAHALGDLPVAPWQVRVSPPAWGLARYNRIEGLSLGARQEIDFGRLSLEGLARIGVADWEPEAQLHVRRETAAAQWQLGAYRRLVDADPATKALGFGNSFQAFFFGRDDGEYFRAWGGELTAVPALTRPQRWELRLYAERQRAVGKETDFSLPHVFDKEQVFRPNLIAQSADEFGGALTLRFNRALGMSGATIGADVALDGAGGDFEFARAALALRTNFTVAGLAAALEVAGGTSTGDVTTQAQFFLGGPQTLRGYGGAASAGQAFWRSRVEVANRWPAARIALFADAGRAGPRADFTTLHPLVGVGIGASFLDGLFRIDVSRAMVGQKGWRVDFYTDGIL